MAVNAFANGLDLGINTPTINLTNTNLSTNATNNTSVSFNQDTNVAPGVPNPSQAQNQSQTVTTGRNVPQPKKVSADTIKARILQPALTSHFECYFGPPPERCSNFIKQGVTDNDITSFLILSCSEASLPGSSLTTHELNNDITGVTQRHAYRRLYDDMADFTFYVNNSYTPIRYFETWIRFIAGEQEAKEISTDLYYPYRVKYPEEYKTSVYITKFERDTQAKGARSPQKIVYTFHNAFPVQIQSMPLSYESSQLLKCTVSFSYDRYTLSNTAVSSIYTKNEEPTQTPAAGVPNQTYSTSGIPEFPPIAAGNFNGNPIFADPPFGVDNINLGSGGIIPPF
jgi:hypothetical protein